MTYNASCVLEGGAMMGVFTAGVLDELMENDIYMSHVIGVSAGSANGLNYAARQKGRTIKCMAPEDKKLQFFGLGTLLRRHTIYDFDLVFFEFADKYFPFDYDEYMKNDIYCEAVVTDVDTGKAAYLPCLKEGKEMVAAARASSSLPFLSRIYECQGINCLDGGVADSLPVRRAMTFGNEKIVVVLTKPYGYRRKPLRKRMRSLIRVFYRKYPNMIKALEDRYRIYNEAMDEIEQLEKEGRVFVFRPDRAYVERMEKDREKLLAGYEAGRACARKELDDLLKYLNS